MPEMMSSEAYQPMTFDAIKIGLASPEKIRSWSHGEVKKTAYSANVFLDHRKTGNVTVVNTKKFAIKALYVIAVV